MLLISGNKNSYCPYRDCLGIDTSDGRISWYQLLGVSQAASVPEMRDRYDRRRQLIVMNRKTTGHPVWENLLDELDRAIAVLTDPGRKQEYDEDLLRRNRQTSLIRLPSKEAAEWNAAMHAESLRESRKSSDTAPSIQPGLREMYEPLRTVGEGPVGTRVYEAWEFRLNRRVAVRCLLRHARTTERRQSFVEEAQFLASISHPNLVEVHSVNARSCFMVMEYLEKTVVSFQTEQKNQQCDEDFVTRFLMDGLRILKRLHEAGVVHGAIGRRSFHLSAAGDIKLVDAPGCTPGGLFRAPRPDQTCVAPELLSPDSFGEPGASADLYMLGFAAFELLAGDSIGRWVPKLAQKGESEQQIRMQWHASPLERLPALKPLVPGISSTLASVIEALCEKQVVDRSCSADAALELLTASEPGRNNGFALPAQPKPLPKRKHVNSRQVGGDAPLIHEARKSEQPAHDILETLQSPALLWQHFRTNSRFRATTLGACVLLLTMFTLAASIGPHHGHARANDRAVSKDDTTPRWSPPSVETSVITAKLDSSAIADSSPTLPKQTVRTAFPTEFRKSDADLELAAVPILFNSLQQQDTRTASEADSSVLAAESITPFSAVLARNGDYSSLIQTLQELRTAKTLQHKRQLFLKAREIAPEDPRIWYLFAAATEFRPEFRNELRKAVELSKASYTQPIRQLIESHLVEVEDCGSSAADTTIALLSDFVPHLARSEASVDNVYEWEWIGRVLGVLEIHASTDPGIAGLLVSAVPRIMSSATAAGQTAIRRGRRFALSMGKRVAKSAILPHRPQISYALCLHSFIDSDIPSAEPASPSSSTSALAKRQD